MSGSVRQCAKYQLCVLGSARQKSDGIERFSQRNDAVQAPDSGARTESDQAAQRGRIAYGARRVGAESGEAHARRNGCRRSGGRASRNSGEVPRVARRAISTNHAAAAKGELVKIILTDDHGTRVF